MSGPLPKPRYEAFCQAIVAGMAIYAAYQKAGYATKTAVIGSKGGAKLLQRGEIQHRIDEIRTEKAQNLARAEEKKVMSALQVLIELSKIGMVNMQDFLVVGETGEPLLDWSKLTRDQAAALQEVTVEEFVDGRSDKRQVRRTKFKLAPKINALELLGKHHGLFVEKHEHTHEHTVLAVLLKEIEELPAKAAPAAIEHRADEAMPVSIMDEIEAEKVENSPK